MRRPLMLIMSISGVKKRVDHPVPQAEIRSPSEQSTALSFSDQRNAFAAPGKSQNDNCNKLFQLRKKEKMEHYKSQMINVRIQQCIGIALILGGAFLALFVVKGGDKFFPLVMPLFGAGFLWQAHSIQKRMEHYAANNYTKYAKDHPAHVTDRGVTCFQCKSPKIHTKNLMQGSFTREHHCGQCGTTLYYSPEQNR